MFPYRLLCFPVIPYCKRIPLRVAALIKSTPRIYVFLPTLPRMSSKPPSLAKLPKSKNTLNLFFWNSLRTKVSEHDF